MAESHKCWIVFDSRYHEDPDRASVYFATGEASGATLETVKADRNEDFPDGVIVEFDFWGGLLKNPRIIP